MRSSASTSNRRAASALAALLAAGVLLGGAGCGGGAGTRERDPAVVEAEAKAAKDGRARLRSLLPGRWTGESVAPPAGVWFEKAKFDLSFGDQDDVSIVVSTFARRPYTLHFEGTYRALDADQVSLTTENLGGVWKVEKADARELVLANTDMKLALRRRYGS